VEWFVEISHWQGLLRSHRRPRGAAFYVAVKSGGSSLSPILRVVGIDSRTVPEGAEEGALRWIDHDSDMPTPHHQIPGLRMSHSLKMIISNIEIGRTCVGVGEARAVIDCVHQVGAITLAAWVKVRIECGDNDRQAVVRGQCNRPMVSDMCPGNCDRASGSLRRPPAGSEPAQNEP
jgi:hypothetical protein